MIKDFMLNFISKKRADICISTFYECYAEYRRSDRLDPISSLTSYAERKRLKQLPHHVANIEPHGMPEDKISYLVRKEQNDYIILSGSGSPAAEIGITVTGIIKYEHLIESLLKLYDLQLSDSVNNGLINARIFMAMDRRAATYCGKILVGSDGHAMTVSYFPPARD